MVLPTAGRSSLGTSRRDLVSPATSPFLLKNFCQNSESWAWSATAAPACSMAARSSLIFSSIVHLVFCVGGKGKIKKTPSLLLSGTKPCHSKLRGTTRVPHKMRHSLPADNGAAPLRTTGLCSLSRAPLKSELPHPLPAGGFQPVTALSCAGAECVLSSSQCFKLL